MGRIPLRPGLRVLDAACGTGNLAVHAARAGCQTSGLDLASNLVAQARSRAGGKDSRLITSRAMPRHCLTPMPASTWS